MGHVCPCAGALSVSFTKSSPGTHDFILSVLDPVTLAVLASRVVSLVGIAGTASIQLGAVVQVGDLLALRHDISGAPATEPGETVVNVYLTPLGNVVPALVSSSTSTGAGATARHEEWEVV